MSKTIVTTNISSIILAGGKSSRMGQDKALLKINNQPLLQILCEMIRDLVDETYIVTPWPEKYKHIVPKNCQLLSEVLLSSNANGEGNGPLVGFAQGLAQVKTEWVLLLACDLPCLEAQIISQWMTLLTQTPEKAIALLPKHPLGWEPLIGFYRSRCLPQVQEFIAQGGRSFQTWLAQQEVAELHVSNPKVLFNCNTPKDLAKLESGHLGTT